MYRQTPLEFLNCSLLKTEIIVQQLCTVGQRKKKKKRNTYNYQSLKRNYNFKGGKNLNKCLIYVFSLNLKIRKQRQKFWVRIPGKSWMSNCPFYQWLSGFALKNGRRRGGRFNHRSLLLTQPFGVFRGFLRNSRKCGLGFLRKTPTYCVSSTGPDPTCGQLVLSQ